MIKVLTLLAAGTGLVQPLLMGMIGYPLARRRNNMEAFHKSGFLWWVITLCLIVVATIIFEPSLFAVMNPSAHGFTVLRFTAAVGVGFVAALAIEITAKHISFGDADARRRKQEQEKFDMAFPPLISQSLGKMLAMLSFIAIVEEAVFRAIALGGLWHGWGLNKVVAAALVSMLFGLCHWYYGPRQVIIKSIVGGAFTWAALSGGWVAAAIAHFLLNMWAFVVEYRVKKNS